MLEPGHTAPDFELNDSEGKKVRLSDLRGRRVVLYFYPKDMTPGCTQEACDFRDRYADIQATGAVLLGVSPDSERSHRNFAEKHSLPFPLLSDPEARVCEAYGVWQEKSMYGKTYKGVERSTFIIDEEGKITHVWRRVKVAGHGDEVLAALRG
ncbi:MAG: thioredoxin-dependent thiol peroxidase [Armatimonadota bacterium]|nr:thioredoxin-dependent thiol peroxidase [Armatimonadota bacterium]